MHRVSHIVGKPIVTTATGDKLGDVADVLFDPEQGLVVGLVVADGWRAAERVLPFPDVQTFGGDAVIVNSAESLIDRKTWGQRGPDTVRSSHLNGKPVVTSAGTRLGTVKDVFIDEESGSVAELEIESPRFGGLMHRASTLATSKDVRIGADAIVVPAAAVGRAADR